MNFCWMPIMYHNVWGYGRAEIKISPQILTWRSYKSYSLIDDVNDLLWIKPPLGEFRVGSNDLSLIQHSLQQNLYYIMKSPYNIDICCYFLLFASMHASLSGGPFAPVHTYLHPTPSWKSLLKSALPIQ